MGSSIKENVALDCRDNITNPVIYKFLLFVKALCITPPVVSANIPPFVAFIVSNGLFLGTNEMVPIGSFLNQLVKLSSRIWIQWSEGDINVLKTTLFQY